MTTNETNDLSLLVSVLEGEEPRIKAFYRRRLLPIAARYDVDDLFGDVTLRALRDWDKCLSRDVHGVQKWVRVIAHNTTMSALNDHIARAKRSVRRESCGSSEATFHQIENAATYRDTDAAERYELIQMCIAVLDQLPSRQAHAIRRFHLDLASYTEIATEMGVTLQAVRSLVSKGLARCSQIAGPELLLLNTKGDE
ncbi:MAG: sigma-70 family RNA polymerase sigma factor [Pirellulaceae bacterium]|nr:sigma-70 family RNA polymerase sigma factor [Pirellulaceae bacterium]